MIAALAFDDSLAEVDFTRALFLDTETTGLSSGAGVLPFVIGLHRSRWKPKPGGALQSFSWRQSLFTPPSISSSLNGRR